MAEYRAYILASDGHIIEGVDLECANDEAARKAAEQLVRGCDVELWQGARKIQTFRHKPE